MDVSSQFYKVRFSNEIHQLLVTPSQHFYVDGDGKFNYRKEHLKVKLKDPRLPNAAAVVFYFLRDKFSGAFYAEMCLGDNLSPVDEFLLRAWNRRNGYRFGGLPDYLIVPNYASSNKLKLFLESLNVELVDLVFSLDAGVRVVRILETELIKYHGEPFAAVIAVLGDILTELNKFRHPNQYLKTQKYEEKWIQNIRALRRPPDAGSLYIR